MNELIDRGASISAVGGRSKWTALHLSTVNGHLSAVKFLLDKGADINSIKKPQGSCLHLAIKEKHIPIISMLLKRGIDLELKDSKGRKAEELIGGDDVVRTLLDNHIKFRQQEIRDALAKSAEIDLDEDIDEELEDELKNVSETPIPSTPSVANSDNIIMKSFMNDKNILNEINNANNNNANKRSTKMFINDTTEVSSPNLSIFANGNASNLPKNNNNNNNNISNNNNNTNSNNAPQQKGWSGVNNRVRGNSFNTDPNSKPNSDILSRSRGSTVDNVPNNNKNNSNNLPNKNTPNTPVLTNSSNNTPNNNINNNRSSNPNLPNPNPNANGERSSGFISPNNRSSNANPPNPNPNANGERSSGVIPPNNQSSNSNNVPNNTPEVPLRKPNGPMKGQSQPNIPNRSSGLSNNSLSSGQLNRQANNPQNKQPNNGQNQNQNNNDNSLGLGERRAKATTCWVRSDVKPVERKPNLHHRTMFFSKEDQQEINELAAVEEALELYQKKRESKRVSKVPLRAHTYCPGTNAEDELIKQLRRKSVRPEFANVEYSDEAPPLWGNSPLMDSNELPDTIPLSEEENQPIEESQTKLINSGNNIVAYPGAERIVHDEEMVWSWLSKVAGVVIDAQAQEALEHILRLLNTLFHDRDQKRSIDALLSLSLVAMKYNNKPITSDFPVTTEEIEVGAYYFKFAAAAYGWKMLNPLMFSNKQARILFQGFTVGDPMNRKALCEHTGIKEEDIKVAKWTSSDYHPAHYIAVDHKTTSIIISVRGSFHVKDALVDLIASASPFKNGFAHTGMLECARRKLEAIQPPLNEAFKEFPEYKVVVVGHSLGAGTASLLTILLKDEYPLKDIQCYAYAPPCVLSAELALSCSNIITSYALGDDCVPRLSFGSIELLKNLTAKIMNQSKSTMKLLLLIKRGKIDPNVLRNEIITSVEDRLLPPGIVYQILKESKQRWIPNEELAKCFRMEKSNPTFFSELIVSSSMFSDHLPWNYHAAFQGIQLRDTLYTKFMSNPSDYVEEAQEKKSFFSSFRKQPTPKRSNS